MTILADDQKALILGAITAKRKEMLRLYERAEATEAMGHPGEAMTLRRRASARRDEQFAVADLGMSLGLTQAEITAAEEAAE